ncbi:hypothetical protein [Caudovirales GX15bay]|nr:hypothetical protein [Caudovirales GX15bay]
MAVDLFTLVDSLKREVNPPGSDLFPDSTDDNWLGSLTDAFWEVRLYGFLSGYEENAAARGGDAAFGEGIVTPHGVDATYDDPTGWSDLDLSRELQQLIVLWAGWKVVLARMGSLSTMFRAKAGPVEYEAQNAASVLKGILDQLKARIDWFVTNLLDTSGANVAVFDQVIERTYAEATGGLWWVR